MHVNVRLVSYILLAAIALITVAKLVHLQATRSHLPANWFSESAQDPLFENATKTIPPAGNEDPAQSPIAFVAFLAGNWQHKEFDDDNADMYFYSTRVMG